MAKGNYSHKVILAHGLCRSPSSMEALETAFRARGFDSYSFSYPTTRLDITTAAHGLYEMINIHSDNMARVHLITHSLGGIVARRVLRLYEEEKVDEKIGAVVMLAPPNNGSTLARLATNWLNILGPAIREVGDSSWLDTFCGVPVRDACILAGTNGADWSNPNVIWGSGTLLDAPHDGTVSVREAALPGVRLVTVDACHTWIASHPEAIRVAVDFVEEVCNQP